MYKGIWKISHDTTHRISRPGYIHSYMVTEMLQAWTASCTNYTRCTATDRVLRTKLETLAEVTIPVLLWLNGGTKHNTRKSIIPPNNLSLKKKINQVSVTAEKEKKWKTTHHSKKKSNLITQIEWFDLLHIHSTHNTWLSDAMKTQELHAN